MLLRLLHFFIGCSHHSVVHIDDVPLMGIQQCQLRGYHKGPHQYPAPWVEGP